MRNFIISFIVLCLAWDNSSAQSRMAVVIGGHQSTVLEKNDLPNWDFLKKTISGRLGLHVGFIADIPISPTSNLFFQPGAVFHNKGRTFKRIYDPSTVPEDTVAFSGKEFLNYIDIPLNVVMKFGNRIKILVGAGPYVGFFFNGKENYEVFYNDSNPLFYENKDLPVGKVPGKYRTLQYGVSALAGMEFNKFFLTANYSRGLNDFYESADYTGSFKHQVIGATLGIFIGKPVAIEVKIKDRDKDGVPDDLDACPTEPGTTLTNGCPDNDADGIADKDDSCPNVAGVTKYNGCPVPDTDKDGIPDDEDKCPEIAGVIKYGGCPIPDSDKDGINDDEDKCPEIAGVLKYDGCPVPDSDGDGIDDENDLCPAVKGVASRNGCPEEITQEIVEKVNYAAQKIQFNLNKNKILSSSFKVLDELVQILKADSSLQLLIEGHTSAEGSLAFNMKLSEERAKAVSEYLIKKGVDKNRLKIKGLGPTQPLNQGETEEDRVLNRRVELILSN